MWIFLLIIVLFLLVLTPPVQNFITGRATNFLEKKLNTKVSIGRLYFTLSGKIALDDIYVEDRQKDTLLSAGELRVNMSLYKLIFGGAIDIKSIRLDEATAKISRQLPDTTFNFQFIIDAFASGSPDTIQVTDSSKAVIDIRYVELNKLRFVYRDVVTGSDVTASLNHFDTRIDTFDINTFHFVVPKTNIDGLVATVIQNKALDPPEIPDSLEAVAAVTTAPVLQLDLGNIVLTKSKVTYTDNPGALFADLDVGRLQVEPRRIELDKSSFDLGDVLLHDTKGVVQLKKRAIVTDTTGSDSTAAVRIFASSLDAQNVAIRFDDENAPKATRGMDYMHLNGAIATLQVKDFILAGDTIAGNITDAKLSEESGFNLEQLRAGFHYAGTGAVLKDLYIKTPGTELSSNITLTYASPDALAKDLANLGIEADIPSGRVQVKDILTFVPDMAATPAFSNPNDVWLLDTRLYGRLGDLHIERLKFSGLSNTVMNLNGHIKGLPNAETVAADLRINEVSTTKADIRSFVPASSLPQNINLPNTYFINGAVKGNMAAMGANLRLQTDIGDAQINGRFSNLSAPQRAGYDLRFSTSSFNLGYLMKDPKTYGRVTADFTAKGRGMDENADATLKGTVQSAVYNGYEYQDLALDASIRNQQFTADASMQDPNIHFALQASGDLNKQTPSIKVEAMIDSIKTLPLNLTPEAMVYHGKISADFPIADPDNLSGEMLITESVLVQRGQRLQLDTISVTAGVDTGSRYLTLQSDIGTARLQGEYRLTELGTVFLNAIDPYYNLPSADGIAQPAPYDFTLTASISDRPVLRSLIPGLERMDGVALNSRFSSTDGIEMLLTGNQVIINGTTISGLNVNANTRDSALALRAAAARITSGTTIAMDSTILTASLLNNNVNFDLDIKDRLNADKYSIAGLLSQAENGDLNLSLRRDGLLLNYDQWELTPDNRILVRNGDINASNFVLSHQGQQLSLNSSSPALNSPLNIKFTDFQLATLTAIAMSDSTLLNGRLNGDVELRDFTTKPVFTGDLLVNDLSYRGDTVGNLQAKVNNARGDIYAADLSLTGRGNDLVVDGKYNASAATFDLDVDIRRLPMKTAEAFSDGAIRNTTGYLNGKLDVTGTATDPNIIGALNFNQAGLNVSQLNSYFTIDQEKINFDAQGISFDRFQVKDSAGNALTIGGTLATNNYRNYNLDLDIRANNFRALNSTKKDNKLFYGTLYFNTNLNVTGTETAPIVDGRLAINEQTKMTVVLPQAEPGVVEREGVVEFIDMDSPISDSLFLAGYDSLNMTGLRGMEISLNVEIDKEADLTMIVDEGNGDFLNVKGEALLNATVSPSGEIVLAGTYELEEGAYELSFNTIRRRFEIQKGSKITWGGEPTDADVDIKARYVANTAPLDLVKGQLDENIATTERNRYLQKLPFEVMLNMEGKLLKPLISFDIILPDNRSYVVSNDIITLVRTKLEQLRQEEGEMNKQVFALLLLNRFIDENPFSGSGSGPNAGTLARQSVSKLMTEQLNRLAEDLVKGVDLNFDIQSSEDYTTGTRADRTDLNVGLSKQLLNDRLTVTVGSNFELEGPAGSNQQSSNIAGNVALNYRLSKDGRYQLRAYRKNEYQGIIEGNIIETGVGFIITLDYNRFRDIFQRKRLQRERQARREQRQREAQQNNAPPANASPPVKE